MAMDATFRCGSGSRERLCRRSPKAWAHPSTQGPPTTPHPHPVHSPRRRVAAGKRCVRVAVSPMENSPSASPLENVTPRIRLRGCRVSWSR
jgi:hypothetical protein